MAYFIRPLLITDAILTDTNVAEADYAVWSAVTTYAALDRVRIVDTDLHKVFQSKVGGNLDNDPLTDDGTNWIEVGSTNRWKMFDQAVQSQTTNPDSIEVEIAAPDLVDTLALLELNAAEARVRQTDAIDGVVFDETISLVSDSGITDLYAFFFKLPARLRNVVIEGLKPYADSVLTVTLTASGETVACGACIPGFSEELGGTQWGAEAGIRDYSKKEETEFGDFVVTKRPYSRWANFNIWVLPGYVDELIVQMADYRATPVVWVGDSDYSSTVVYGYFEDVSVNIAYPTISDCSLKVKGLT